MVSIFVLFILFIKPIPRPQVDKWQDAVIIQISSTRS